MKNLKDQLVHRWFRIPYLLHCEELIDCKKPVATVILLHGLGNTFNSWRPVVNNLPKNIRVLGIDLLGFGSSPKPTWATYNLTIQINAVARTLLNIKIKQKPIIVGHSLGALIAIGLATKWPLVTRDLLLCSPPVYDTNQKSWFSRQRLLFKLYKYLEKHPDNLHKIAPTLVNKGFANQTFNVKGERINTYINALENSIVKQNLFEKLKKIKVPTLILYGLFDPLVIGKNLRHAAAMNNNIKLDILPVSHEVTGQYARITAQNITMLTTNKY